MIRQIMGTIGRGLIPAKPVKNDNRPIKVVEETPNVWRIVYAE